MAVDKLVDSTQLDADLTSVANAIRTKGGTSSQLAFPSGFVSAVQAIPTGQTPTGTKQISITENGTTTEDVTNYANAEITVNVPGGGAVTQDQDGYLVLSDEAGGGGDYPKYTRYTLTGDTTLKTFLESINYEVPSALVNVIIIRSSGSAVPSSGSYTLNNFMFIFKDGERYSGRHYYISGHAAADSFPDLPATNENVSTMAITAGVLVYNGSVSTSPLGTAGTVVTLYEMSSVYDNDIMNGGAI